MEQETKNPADPSSKIVIISLVFIICFITGAVFYHVVEGYSYVNAIYFTAMTLTTVGYGDFTPQTDIGKLFTALYAFVGVATFLGLAAALFQAALHRHHRIHKQ